MGRLTGGWRMSVRVGRLLRLIKELLTAACYPDADFAANARIEEEQPWQRGDCHS